MEAHGQNNLMEHFTPPNLAVGDQKFINHVESHNEINAASGLSATARKLLDISEVRKRQKFSAVRPKVNQTWEAP